MNQELVNFDGTRMFRHSNNRSVRVWRSGPKQMAGPVGKDRGLCNPSPVGHRLGSRSARSNTPSPKRHREKHFYFKMTGNQSLFFLSRWGRCLTQSGLGGSPGGYQPGGISFAQFQFIEAAPGVRPPFGGEPQSDDRNGRGGEGDNGGIQGLFRSRAERGNGEHGESQYRAEKINSLVRQMIRPISLLEPVPGSQRNLLRERFKCLH